MQGSLLALGSTELRLEKNVIYFKSGNKEKGQLYVSLPTKITFTYMHCFYMWSYWGFITPFKWVRNSEQKLSPSDASLDSDA